MAFINNIPKYRLATSGSYSTYYSTQCIPLNLPIEYLGTVEGESDTYKYTLSGENSIIIGGINNNSPFITGVSPIADDISMTRTRKSTGVSETFSVDTSLLTSSIHYLKQSTPFILTESSSRYIVNTEGAEKVTVQLDDLLQLFSNFTGTTWDSIYYFLTLSGVNAKITYPVYPAGWPNVLSSASRGWGLFYLTTALHDPSQIPITYVPISSILNGPAQANIGDEIEVDVSFPDGYKLKDATQGSGISVYNDNGYIDFTYDEAARKLRFTMPE